MMEHEPIYQLERAVIMRKGAEMIAVDPGLEEEFRREGYETVTKAVTIAEGYGPEWGVHIMQGEDGKYYALYSEAAGNRVVAVLDSWFTYK
jgi:hypothetical protein